MQPSSNHISPGKIALQAGNDLSMIESISVRWHLRGCQQCRQELTAARAAIKAFREEALELPADLTGRGFDWDTLAAEMRGNISVGLEAAHAIESYSKPELTIFDWRPAAAVAAITMVASMGWYLSFHNANLINNPAVLLEANTKGAEWKHGDLSLSFKTRSEEGSFVDVNVKGVASARYVDSETGQVAITNVYVD